MKGLVLGVGVERERRPVARRHDLDHARMRLGGFDVEMGDPAAGDRGGRNDGVEQAVRVVVGGVGARPVTLSRPSRRVIGWPILEPWRMREPVGSEAISDMDDTFRNGGEGRAGKRRQPLGRAGGGHGEGARRRRACRVRS